MERVELLIIDKNKNSVVVELEKWQIKGLGITKEKVKTHKTKGSIQKELTEFFKT